MKLTADVAAIIVAQVRTGSDPVDAARAAGVSAKQFRHWLHLGRQRKGGMYVAFRRNVQQARGQALAKAGMEARAADVKWWLRFGPGRKLKKEAAVAGVASAELLKMIGEIAQVLGPWPEARQAVLAYLDQLASPNPKPLEHEG